MQIEKLTESEEIVMKAVWDCKKEPVSSEVLERVNTVYGKDWKTQTVSTFLAKLVQKNYLALQRNGKTYTYKVLVQESVYNKNQLNRLLLFLYKSDKETMKQDLETL